MKKLSLIALLTLMMMVVSFEAKTQETSTVIVSAMHSSNNVIIETVLPDYSIEKKEIGRGKNPHILIELKKELDLWIKKGYEVKHSIPHDNGSFTNIRFTFILMKEE